MGATPQDVPLRDTNRSGRACISPRLGLFSPAFWRLLHVSMVVLTVYCIVHSYDL